MTRFFAPILLAALTALPAALQADTPRITVTGSGAVSRAPDQAEMTLGVTRFAASAAAAMEAVNRDQSAVIAALKEAGIAPADLQTTGLDVGPDYRQSQDGSDSPPPRYRASNRLRILLRDLDRIGPILDRVFASGANDFSGVSFQIADPRAAEDAARRLALADAHAKAALYAAELGQTLGPVLQLREGGSAQPVMMARAAQMDSAIAPGMLDISVSVTVDYALAPAE